MKQSGDEQFPPRATGVQADLAGLTQDMCCSRFIPKTARQCQADLQTSHALSLLAGQNGLLTSLYRDATVLPVETSLVLLWLPAGERHKARAST